MSQNEDVKRLAAWAAIIAVPTMIAGVYGMNFEQMPELQWRFGYPVSLGLMASACAALYIGFKQMRTLSMGPHQLIAAAASCCRAVR